MVQLCRNGPENKRRKGQSARRVEKGIAEDRPDEPAEMAGGDRDADVADMMVGEDDLAGDLFEDRFAKDTKKED